jgi:hypothetical protein
VVPSLLRGLPQFFFADYLTVQGSEVNIYPKEGMSHSVEVLSKVTWQHHLALEVVLDLVALMAKQVGEERPKFWQLRYRLAYAYTEIQRTDLKGLSCFSVARIGFPFGSTAN